MTEDIQNRFDTHPCFNREAGRQYARIHLPVAPKCNMSCNYCNRAVGDCVNESRPGVASTLLKPRQALAYLEAMADRLPVSVAGIAGPGDPLANPNETLETMRLVRRRFPDMLLCLSTNGLALPEYADKIAEIGVSHVTVTCNAVDPLIGANLYAWMRSGPFNVRGIDAAKLLLERQEAGVRCLAEKGIIVKINTVVVPSINENHVERIAETAAQWGAAILNPMAMIPVEGAVFENLEEPDAGEILLIRSQAAKHISVMTHCRRCRADAAGLLGEENAPDAEELLRAASQMPLSSGADRPCIAVTSREGMLINSHLGESFDVLIFEKKERRYEYREKRALPASGTVNRWELVSAILRDCSHLLTNGIGGPPQAVLEREGIECLELEGIIELALSNIHSGMNPNFMKRRIKKFCDGAGGGCAG